MDDIKKTLVYIAQDKLEFWNKMTSWPTTTANEEEN